MFTVLCDNDGVLVDTEGLYFRATQVVLQTVGVPLSLEQFQKISLRRGESTFILAAQAGIPEPEIEELREARNDLYADFLRAESHPVDGAAEALRALHGQVKMGVVTSSRRDHFEIAHARTGLIQYMDFVLTHEDYHNSKPDPEPYLTAIERFALEPNQCVVVEDSERGLVSATAAGLPCLIVLSHWTRGGDFAKAAKVLHSIHEVPDAVLAMAKSATP